jgi:hypothetical protein
LVSDWLDKLSNSQKLLPYWYKLLKRNLTGNIYECFLYILPYNIKVYIFDLFRNLPMMARKDMYILGSYRKSNTVNSFCMDQISKIAVSTVKSLT